MKITHRLWRLVDRLAHLLYTPTMLSRRCVRARWHHRIHLISRKWLDAACWASDQALLKDQRYLASLDWQATVGPPGEWYEHIYLNGERAVFDPDVKAFVVPQKGD